MMGPLSEAVDKLNPDSVLAWQIVARDICGRRQLHPEQETHFWIAFASKFTPGAPLRVSAGRWLWDEAAPLFAADQRAVLEPLAASMFTVDKSLRESLSWIAATLDTLG